MDACHRYRGYCADITHPLPPPTADPALRLTRQLETGMVVTIKPGCYVIPLLLDPLKASPAGADNLTPRLGD